MCTPTHPTHTHARDCVASICSSVAIACGRVALTCGPSRNDGVDFSHSRLNRCRSVHVGLQGPSEGPIGSAMALNDTST